MNLHGMNKKHEETNYCAFDENRKLKGTKDCIFIYAKSSFAFSVLKMMTDKRKMPKVKSCWWQQWSEIECCAKSNKVWSFLELTYLEIQVRARNIMMADAQTDYLNDYWTNCKTATRNLSGDLVEVLRLVIHTARKF